MLAQLGIARTREGLASLLERRLVAWDALDRFLARGPADLTAEVVCRRAADVAAGRAARGARRPRRFLADGPVAHPRYQLLVRDLRRLSSTDRDAPRRRRADSRAAGPRRGALPDRGRQAARRAGAIHPYKTERDYPSPEASKRHRDGRRRRSRRTSRTSSSAFSRDLNVVLARGIRRMFAIALDAVPPGARRALGPRLLGRAPARARSAPPDGRVLAEPLPARIALPPRPGRRVPGHEPRAVGARLAADSSVGRRARPRHAVRRSSSSATGSSRSTASATRRSRSCRRPAATSRRCGRPGTRVGRSPQLPRGAGAAGVRQRAVRGDVAVRARGRTTSPTRSRIGFRLDGCRLGRSAAKAGTAASAVRCSGSRWPTIPTRARRRWRRKSRASCARRRSATGRPASRGRHGPETSRSSFARAPAIASSSTSSRCAAFRPTSTRASASSTPTRSRTSRR